MCTLFILKDAPARLRFYVVITALFTWFIPWNLIATVPIMTESLAPLTDEVFNSFFWLESIQTVETKTLVSSVNQLDNASAMNIDFTFNDLLNLSMLIALISVIGLLLFIKDIVSYQSDLKYWMDNSREDNSLLKQHDFKNSNISIRILDDCGPGMATGLIKPTIWLNKNYKSTSTAKTILTHELNHIEQNDPAWMWLVTFTQRFFWWNPLVRLLTGIAREEIELSCDEKCRQQLQEHYSIELAKILLNGNTAPAKYITAISIKGRGNFNITRIKQLTKESKMKTKHLLALVVGFSMIGVVGAAVSYEKPSEAQNITAKKNSSYESAKIKLHRSADQTGSELHNELVDELLEITQKAKSNNPEIINQILLDIEKWNTTRRVGPDKRSESWLKNVSFTMMANLLYKLEHFDKIPTAYDTIFPDKPIEKQLGLKHHIATAYIQMGLPEKALDLMSDVIERQPSPKTGTLMLLAHANLAAANYNQVISTADELLKATKYESQSIIALNYKRAAYIAKGNAEKANEVNHVLAESYSAKGSAPVLIQPGSPLLSYLPELSEDKSNTL